MGGWDRMRTLILNGSPRPNGDTAALIGALRETILGEVRELSAFYDNLSPCIDCRWCNEHMGCVIRDGMDAVYADDYDVVVVASPLYMSNLTGPLMNVASRLQAYYAARRFLKRPPELRKKTGVLLLTGGGDGRPDDAIRLAKWVFRFLNADFPDENLVLSMNTDAVPAARDDAALAQVRAIARRLNGG